MRRCKVSSGSRLEALPSGRQSPKAVYSFRDHLENSLDLSGSVEARQGKADARSRSSVRQSHSFQDVGWFRSSGLAGTSSGDGKAFKVESDHQGLGFDMIEEKITGIRGARGSSTIYAGCWDLAQESLFKMIAQVDQGCGTILGEPCLSEGSGLTQSHNARYIFRAGPALTLMRPSVKEGSEANVAAGKENAGSLRSIHLVAGDAEKIHFLQLA